MIRRPPRSTLDRSSAASDVYKRQHPVGATGVKQIVELVEQLRKTAGKRQVVHAKAGLAHNVGGSGATAVIHILTI